MSIALVQCAPQITPAGTHADSYHWLAQYLADISGLPVSRPIESEATLLGLAYLVSEGRCQINKDARRFEPETNAVAQHRLEAWTAAMDAEVQKKLTAVPK